MAMSSAPERAVLPCGREVSTLYEHVASGRLDEHEQSCPHCQGASFGLRALHGATGGLARTDVVPPGDLTARIMHAVRAEARRGDDLFVERGGRGWTRVSARAAAAVLRVAAGQVPGVVARSCSLHPVSEEEGSYTVRLGIALRYGTDGRAASDHVRRLVGAAARDLVGFDNARVDIDLVDVLESRPLERDEGPTY